MPIKKKRSVARCNPSAGTFTDWVRKSGITMTATGGDYAVEPASKSGGRPWNHYAWKVTLRRKGKSMSVTFRMGEASGGAPPKLVEVLYSVVSDVSSFEGTLPIGGKGDEYDHITAFAREYGYENVGDALRVFKAVKSEAARFKALLGPAEYQRVLSLEMDY